MYFLFLKACLRHSGWKSLFIQAKKNKLKTLILYNRILLDMLVLQFYFQKRKKNALIKSFLYVEYLDIIILQMSGLLLNLKRHDLI